MHVFFTTESKGYLLKEIRNQNKKKTNKKSKLQLSLYLPTYI